MSSTYGFVAYRLSGAHAVTFARRVLWTALGLALGAVLASEAPAQGLSGVGGVGSRPRDPSRPQYWRSRGRPTVSPYLNLSRGDGSSALNYYNLVRPQVDQYHGQQAQASEIGRLEQQIGVLEATNAARGRRQSAPVRATGHPATFFNYSHYFPGSAGGYGAGTGSQ